MPRSSELRELNEEALLQSLAESTDEHFKLRFQHATGQLDNSNRLGEVRRQIARIRTLLREREILAAEDQTAGEL